MYERKPFDPTTSCADLNSKYGPFRAPLWADPAARVGLLGLDAKPVQSPLVPEASFCGIPPSQKTSACSPVRRTGLSGVVPLLLPLPFQSSVRVPAEDRPMFFPKTFCKNAFEVARLARVTLVSQPCPEGM